MSEIMSHMDLAVFPQIGLILFLAIFAAAMWRVARKSGSEMRRCAFIPLEDDVVTARPGEAKGVGA